MTRQILALPTTARSMTHNIPLQKNPFLVIPPKFFAVIGFPQTIHFLVNKNISEFLKLFSMRTFCGLFAHTLFTSQIFFGVLRQMVYRLDACSDKDIQCPVGYPHAKNSVSGNQVC